MPEGPAPTVETFLQALRDVRCPDQRATIAKRLGPRDRTHGIRMRDLFQTARAATRMPLDQLPRLLADPLYEVRMGAFCIMDFRARTPCTDEAERRQLYDLYLEHHDRITTWDMVDRAAPSVVGGYLLGRDVGQLHALAEAHDPLRRRTAMTAPLWFVRHGDDDQLTPVLDLAAALLTDPDPLVSKAVGIALKHAGARDAARVTMFLEKHRAGMPASVMRAGAAKLDVAARTRLFS